MCSQWLGQKVPKGKTQAVSIPGLNLVICSFFILSHTDTKKTMYFFARVEEKRSNIIKVLYSASFHFLYSFMPFYVENNLLLTKDDWVIHLKRENSIYESFNSFLHNTFFHQLKSCFADSDYFLWATLTDWVDWCLQIAGRFLLFCPFLLCTHSHPALNQKKLLFSCWHFLDPSRGSAPQCSAVIEVWEGLERSMLKD